MKKVLLFIIPACIIAVIAILSYQFFFLNKNERGALQVTSSPQSKVYLGDTMIGQTPLCKCEVGEMLSVGSYTLRLVPNDPTLSEYQEKIEIAPSVLTVVDRKFAKGAESEGSVIFLSPLKENDATELLVLSLPDISDVFMDNAAVGQTPLLLEEVTESDHELRVKRSGYKDKVVRIRTPKGYKLTARVYLGIDGQAIPAGSSSATAVVQEDTLSPTPSSKLTPTPRKSLVEKVVILETPNGFLRVREEPSTTATEITRVSTGDTFDLVDEQSGWLQIKLANGTEGWISSQYAEKQ